MSLVLIVTLNLYLNNLTMLGSLSGSVKSGDFGRVVNLRACYSLSDDEKYFLLKNHFCSRT